MVNILAQTDILEVKSENKKLIVVLGMHRSGTSAITAGLEVLGVSLGDRLLRPMKGQNDKGYFEDIDLNEFNIECLEVIGKEWSSLTAITPLEIAVLHKKGYFLSAVNLLRKKIALNGPIFGFKDPRVLVLLPFWKDVFDYCRLEVNYLYVIRHPFSVVNSLVKRDSMFSEQASMLWLMNVITSLVTNTSPNRVIVDYDRFIKSPYDELNRISTAFGLTLDQVNFESYETEFIDNKLRHTFFELDDLLLDNESPIIIREIYSSLLQLASDNINFDEITFQKDIERWAKEFAQLKCSLELVDKVLAQKKDVFGTFSEQPEIQISILKTSVHDKDVHIFHIEKELDRLNQEIPRLLHDKDRVIHDKDVHIFNIETELDRLGQVLATRDNHIIQIEGVLAQSEEALTQSENRFEVSKQAFCEIMIPKAKSKKFNKKFYLKSNPDISKAKVNPIAHYLFTGLHEGRSPTPPKSFVALIPTIISRHGGLTAFTKKLYAVYRRGGVGGIKNLVLRVRQQNTSVKSLDHSYASWISQYDSIDEKKRAAIRQRIGLLTKRPLISVVMPVYNPPIEMLEQAIRSVQAQLYANWELCIADDASTNSKIAELLNFYVDNDSRIKVVFREENGHISEASNSALELVTGDYVALLDHDDLLSEEALFWVADTVIRYPDAGLIYSDEDKIDTDGQRYAPYFKSDWNPDLFLSHNMICHLGVYRTELVTKVGGFREGYEGAQDYDLALRCSEQLSPQQIIHIPRVLYHWRSHTGSTAQAGSEKNYALMAGERALNDHFKRMEVSAKAELLNFGMYRAFYSIPAAPPLISLIIPTRNGLELLKQCIDSILPKTTYNNYEILIVDNNTDCPKTLAYLERLVKNERIKILHDQRPFNYSALNNAAIKQAKGEYVLLINNDIEVISPEWLTEMLTLAIQPGVGAVGARLLYPNDTLQHAGVIMGLGGVAGHSHKHLHKTEPGYFYRVQLIQTLSAVTAACLLIKKSIYNQVNGLDEENLAVAFNDVDFCLRVREAGYRNVWTPYAELYHHESATRGYEDTPEKKLRFKNEVLYMKKRWGDELMNDPAYSPNLTLDYEDFSYAWPPRVSTLNE